MNSGIGRIIIGIVFMGLGGMRLAQAQSQGYLIFSVFMMLYGLFSVGHGIYKIVNKNKNSVTNNEETLDEEIE